VHLLLLDSPIIVEILARPECNRQVGHSAGFVAMVSLNPIELF
jgi:hypothetical protein